VLLGKGAINVDQLEADQLEAPLLEPGEDPPDELALDSIGLDEEKGALRFRHGSYRPLVSWATPGRRAGWFASPVAGGPGTGARGTRRGSIG
jgi:hypothetical protein